MRTRFERRLARISTDLRSMQALRGHIETEGMRKGVCVRQLAEEARRDAAPPRLPF